MVRNVPSLERKPGHSSSSGHKTYIVRSIVTNSNRTAFRIKSIIFSKLAIKIFPLLKSFWMKNREWIVFTARLERYW